MRAFLIVLTCLVAVGCTTAPRTVPVPTKVAVGVACKAVVPDEPAWPTKTTKIADNDPHWLDKFVSLAMAEIELREGYEARLLAELKSCL